MPESNREQQRTESLPVPRNEYDRALSVLTNRIDHLRNQKHTLDKSAANNIATDTDIDEKEIELYSAIVDRFQKLTKPDDHIESRQGIYDTPTKERIQKAIELHEKQSAGVDIDVDDEISLSSSSNASESQSKELHMDHVDDVDVDEGDEDEDEMMDEEDLIDQDALRKAKELRNKIRIAATKLRQTRDAKITGTMEALKHNLSKLETIEKDMSEFDQAHDEKSQHPTVDLSAMERSISLLMTDLNKFRGDLSDQLQSLRDTVESVSKSLEKKREGNISGTERAIQSRESDEVWRRKFGGILHQEDTALDQGGELSDDGVGCVPASTRFAMFLSSSSRV
jgi:hypothetical protein